ncbi:hypothetical protein COU80_03345 [Candidatus Peregrinibacteria bacterium CG10_big_fil_rev_8_21_14_0_10_55_24]|nr:MAG: hypothetical protein COU80_03345 [Candidatus Peregrinibacteria bacterium CG10_big_fil_rev_8_21_14_0_10_55_24]
MQKKGDVYRSCAAIVVLRKTAQGHEVLLLHKPRKRDAWQLPQGGRESGESLEQAAERELMEEAGIRVRLLGRTSTVYQYDFPASYRRFRPDNVCGQRVEFVFAVMDQPKAVQVDAHEIDAYVWVHPSKIHMYIRRKQYLGVVRRIVQEAIALLPQAA